MAASANFALKAGACSPIGAPPDVFAKELAAESETWSRVIRAAGLKLQ
jgi:hypothetical protein